MHTLHVCTLFKSEKMARLRKIMNYNTLCG